MLSHHAQCSPYKRAQARPIPCLNSCGLQHRSLRSLERKAFDKREATVKVRLHRVTNYKQRYDISACPRSGCSVAVVGITALVDVVGST